MMSLRKIYKVSLSSLFAFVGMPIWGAAAEKPADQAWKALYACMDGVNGLPQLIAAYATKPPLHVSIPLTVENLKDLIAGNPRYARHLPQTERLCLEALRGGASALHGIYSGPRGQGISSRSMNIALIGNKVVGEPGVYYVIHLSIYHHGMVVFDRISSEYFPIVPAVSSRVVSTAHWSAALSLRGISLEAEVYKHTSVDALSRYPIPQVAREQQAAAAASSAVASSATALPPQKEPYQMPEHHDYAPLSAPEQPARVLAPAHAALPEHALRHRGQEYPPIYSGAPLYPVRSTASEYSSMHSAVSGLTLHPQLPISAYAPMTPQQGDGTALSWAGAAPIMMRYPAGSASFMPNSFLSVHPARSEGSASGSQRVYLPSLALSAGNPQLLPSSGLSPVQEPSLPAALAVPPLPRFHTPAPATPALPAPVAAVDTHTHVRVPRPSSHEPVRLSAGTPGSRYEIPRQDRAFRRRVYDDNASAPAGTVLTHVPPAQVVRAQQAVTQAPNSCCVIL